MTSEVLDAGGFVHRGPDIRRRNLGGTYMPGREPVTAQQAPGDRHAFFATSSDEILNQHTPELVTRTALET